MMVGEYEIANIKFSSVSANSACYINEDLFNCVVYNNYNYQKYKTQERMKNHVKDFSLYLRFSFAPSHCKS